MLEALFYLAALAALAGAVKRNITAIALLASNTLGFAMCKLGVEFNAALWMVIDTAAIMFIVRPGMKRLDWIIVAPFLPVIWPLYVLQPDWWAQAVIVIVALQMFLTFPAEWVLPILRRWRRFNKDYDPWGDLRAYA